MKETGGFFLEIYVRSMKCCFFHNEDKIHTIVDEMAVGADDGGVHAATAGRRCRRAAFAEVRFTSATGDFTDVNIAVSFSKRRTADVCTKCKAKCSAGNQRSIVVEPAVTDGVPLIVSIHLHCTHRSVESRV